VLEELHVHISACGAGCGVRDRRRTEVAAFDHELDALLACPSRQADRHVAGATGDVEQPQSRPLTTPQVCDWGPDDWNRRRYGINALEATECVPMELGIDIRLVHPLGIAAAL
jgi:hypothetical protein